MSTSFPIRHIVYDCVPGAFAGGVQKMVFELASAQRRLGADVEIWAPNAIRKGAVEDHAGLPIRYFNSYGFGHVVKSSQILRELKLLSPATVFHAHNTFHPLNLQVASAAHAKAHKVFYHPHGALDPVLFNDSTVKSLKKRLYIRFLALKKLNRATGIIALTPLESKQLKSLGVTSPIQVVPNGIKPLGKATEPEVQAFRRRHALAGSIPTLLFVGRIHPKKRIEDIVSALSTLTSSNRPVQLVIAGDPQACPEYHSELCKLAERLGVKDRVYWVGFLNEKEKLAAYAAAHFFVHASDSEGMALSILEGMSSGLPVVVTRGCYMQDAADAGTLVQCEQGAAALGEALGSLLNDATKALALAQSGQKYVHSTHAWPMLAQRLLTIYAEGVLRV
jgi:glycosyltransferase involved in cell wall biosynthesis